jgi:signal transduction histidine kinase
LDAQLCEQDFVNLILNAFQAMDVREGWLTITAAPASSDGKPGVAVEFQDTGRGMDPNVVGHVFDPFFTTKPSGTGLGLSISHELVRAHGGDIRIDSQEGRGTSVKITIPANLT